MADPIVEKIAQQLVTRLQTITTANGYNQDVSDVKRPKTAQRDVAPDHLLAVLLQYDPEPDEEHSHPGNPYVIAWKQLFGIGLYVMPTEADTEAIEARINRFVADAIKAIASPANWERFAGNAINARFLAPVMFEHADGAHDGAVLPVEVVYRHPINDPYTPA